MKSPENCLKQAWYLGGESLEVPNAATAAEPTSDQFSFFPEKHDRCTAWEDTLRDTWRYANFAMVSHRFTTVLVESKIDGTQRKQTSPL